MFFIAPIPNEFEYENANQLLRRFDRSVPNRTTMKPSTFFLSTWLFLTGLTTGFGQPTITKQPSNQTASLFADATFRLAVSGDPPLSYQWRFNNADLIGM